MDRREVLIINGARTPIGRYGGVFKDIRVHDLGVAAMKGALEKSKVKPEQLDQVIVGHARQAGNGPNAGRIVAVQAGVPVNVPAYTVNVTCTSGMLAVMLAYQAIVLGDRECILTAGMEHHSSVPYLSFDHRWGVQGSGDSKLVDGQFNDGYYCGIEHVHMGLLTDRYAQELGITREQQDRFSYESQQRVKKAKASGFFARTIVPVTVPQRKGPPKVITEDETPRPETTMEVLATLKPAFRPDGTITAGNAPTIPDGASAIVITSRDKAKELGLKPLGRVLSYELSACDPKRFGVSQVPGIPVALKKAGLTMKDIDSVEINEAFAAEVIMVMDQAHIDPKKVNIHGGGCSLGHPTGMSGNRLVMDVLNTLHETGGHYGLACICGNGGNGGSVVVEKLTE